MSDGSHAAAFNLLRLAEGLSETRGNVLLRKKNNCYSDFISTKSKPGKEGDDDAGVPEVTSECWPLLVELRILAAQVSVSPLPFAVYSHGNPESKRACRPRID
jgi:hypothetical protein